MTPGTIRYCDYIDIYCPNHPPLSLYIVSPHFCTVSAYLNLYPSLISLILSLYLSLSLVIFLVIISSYQLLQDSGEDNSNTDFSSPFLSSLYFLFIITHPHSPSFTVSFAYSLSSCSRTAERIILPLTLHTFFLLSIY